jgi:hypothetical protein
VIDPAARGLDNLTTDDVARGSTLHEDIRFDRFEESTRCLIVEDEDVIDTSQRREHPSSIVFPDDRPLRSLELSNTFIAVDGDDQYIAQLSGFFQERDMADMQEIETAVREHNRLPGSAMSVDTTHELIETQGPGRSGLRPVEFTSDLGACDRFDAERFNFQPCGRIGQLETLDKRNLCCEAQP